jgi:hypothetical protein
MFGFILARCEGGGVCCRYFTDDAAQATHRAFRGYSRGLGLGFDDPLGRMTVSEGRRRLLGGLLMRGPALNRLGLLAHLPSAPRPQVKLEVALARHWGRLLFDRGHHVGEHLTPAHTPIGMITLPGPCPYIRFPQFSTPETITLP